MKFRKILLIIFVLIPGLSNAQIEVTLTQQSSEGMTDQDLNMEVLSFLKEWVSNETRAQLEASYKRNGVPYSNLDDEFHVEAQYVTRKQKKLMEFSIEFDDDQIKMKRIMGIVGEKLVTVGCTSTNGEIIAKFSGPCGEKILSVFYD